MKLKRFFKSASALLMAVSLSFSPAVTVHASTFTDISTFYGLPYYADAVNWGVRENVVSGYDGFHFGPNDKVTRAQFVTFLYRAGGSPDVGTVTRVFRDLPSNQTYQNAITWAVENGITSGKTSTSFAPNDAVTREQAITFLWKCAGSPGTSGTSVFSDVRSNKYYAKAVNWGVSSGVTSGYSDGRFGVGDITTRAQAITFIYNTFGDPASLTPSQEDLFQYLGRPVGVVVNTIGNLTYDGATSDLEYTDDENTLYVTAADWYLNSPVQYISIYSDNPGYFIAGTQTGESIYDNADILLNNGFFYSEDASGENYFTFFADNNYSVTLRSENGMTTGISCSVGA